MNMKTLLAATAIALSLPVAAQAQGLVRGAERGAQDGSDVAGPLGAIVGGASSTAHRRPWRRGPRESMGSRAWWSRPPRSGPSRSR